MNRPLSVIPRDADALAILQAVAASGGDVLADVVRSVVAVEVDEFENKVEGLVRFQWLDQSVTAHGAVLRLRDDRRSTLQSAFLPNVIHAYELALAAEQRRRIFGSE